MRDESAARRLRVSVTDALGRPARVGTLAAWLCGVAPARAVGSVSIALVDDGTMQRLNRRFAGKNRVTDVLSFPVVVRGHEGPRHTGPRILGDIVIATGVARRQAADAGHAYGRELRVLALHGLLHLLGYDHETDDGTMARVEARLRRKAGLSAGVIERAGPA